MKRTFIMTQDEICSAIASYLIEEKNLDLSHGMVYFEPTKNGKYEIIIHSTDTTMELQ